MKFLLVLFTFTCFGLLAQTSEEDERKRILEQYGSVEQYNKATEKKINMEGSTEIESSESSYDEIEKRDLDNALSEDSSDPNEDDNHKEELQAILKKRMMQYGFLADGKLNESVFTKMLDDKTKINLAQMIKNNPFTKSTQYQIKRSFLEKTDGTALGKMLKENPKILNIIAEIFHDKDALPAFLSIVNRPQKLKIYSACVLGIFIAVFFLNLMQSKAGFLKRFFIKISLMLGSLVANFGLFYFMFSAEIKPIVTIVLRAI